MRKISKYQIYNKLNLKLKKFPLRILNFKRPKWSKIQKSFLSYQKKDLVPNLFFYKSSFKSWEKVKKYYKNFLIIKRSLFAFQDSKVSSRDKSLLLKKDIILQHLLKPEFRIDILLWNLFFFGSSFEAAQKINSGHVLLNGKKVISTRILKKGDIITVCNQQNISNSLKKYSFNKKFLSFVEVDYYTNSIIILKNFKELSDEDICLIVCDYLNIKVLTSLKKN